MNKRTQIRGIDGSVQFTIDESPDGTKTVRNKHGELLGRIVHGQRRDRYGNLLSPDNNLGSLMTRTS